MVYKATPFKFHLYNQSYNRVFRLERGCMEFEFICCCIGLCIGPKSFFPRFFSLSLSLFPLSFDPTVSLRKKAIFRKEMLVGSEGINARRGPIADPKPTGRDGQGPMGPIRPARAKASRAGRRPGWARIAPVVDRGYETRQGPATRGRWLVE